jgi:ubiquinone/menaquinone biosynthesis C-methylase UbiE
VQYYPEDRARIVPFIGRDRRWILDLGCGRGESLTAANPPAGAEIWAVDVDATSLAQAKAACPSCHFYLTEPGWTCLPFPDQKFDCVISRGALMMMKISVALQELHRVMQPGAPLWLSLHGYETAWMLWLRALQRGHWRDAIYRVFVALNGLVFHFFGVNICLSKSRCESFQTKRGMRIALHRAGFVNVMMEKDELCHFVVTATRDGSTHT